MTSGVRLAALRQWIDAHFAEEVAFLQALVAVPTDTPPGENAPHARRTAELLRARGLAVEEHPVPAALVRAQGMRSITNLVVRRPQRRAEAGPVIALNAHGDVVPPGEGWTYPPYGAVIEGGRLFGRAAAVSKSDFATYTFALCALESLGADLVGSVELHFTYDEEFGGLLGPGWLLETGRTRPDLVIAAGFSYEVITAHNGCLQFEVTVRGQGAHAAIPDSGVDALEAAVVVLNELYAQNVVNRTIVSAVPGITHPYLNVGWIEGGTHTNVVPGLVRFKLDRRLIPEENPAEVETALRAAIARAAAQRPRVEVAVQRLLMVQSLRPDARAMALGEVVRRHAEAVFRETIAVRGTPLYCDARLYAAAGAAAVLYGAGPRTVLESNAKRADENLLLEDLRRATLVVAATLLELLDEPPGGSTAAAWRAAPTALEAQRPEPSES